jgi:four helix bundle protein
MGRSYRDLIAWQKAMRFVTEIYVATQRFPSEKRYGITNQLRRAAVSVPSNIAEGQARFSQKEFHHFLRQTRGSLVEIETQLLIARDLKYLQPTKADALLADADERKSPERTHCLDQEPRSIARSVFAGTGKWFTEN